MRLIKKVVDYVIRFHSEQSNLEVIVNQTFPVVKELVDYYHYKKVEQFLVIWLLLWITIILLKRK